MEVLLIMLGGIAVTAAMALLLSPVLLAIGIVLLLVFAAIGPTLASLGGAILAIFFVVIFPTLWVYVQVRDLRQWWKRRQRRLAKAAASQQLHPAPQP